MWAEWKSKKLRLVPRTKSPVEIVAPLHNPHLPGHQVPDAPKRRIVRFTDTLTNDFFSDSRYVVHFTLLAPVARCRAPIGPGCLSAPIAARLSRYISARIFRVIAYHRYANRTGRHLTMIWMLPKSNTQAIGPRLIVLIDRITANGALATI
jgi:hypothetical protein